MAVTVQDVVNYVLKTPLNTNKAILTAMLEELAGGAIVDGVIQLRRNNDFNYDKVADTFVPANGEICLVDTARDGLRVKCGDGVTVWRDLDYIDEFVVKGYFLDGDFYKDAAHTEIISPAVQKIYIDILDRTLYFYHEGMFYDVAGTGHKTTANEDTPGVMKLYQTTGENEDGTMSQKAIYQELNEKVEATFNADEEMLILDADLI